MPSRKLNSSHLFATADDELNGLYSVPFDSDVVAAVDGGGGGAKEHIYETVAEVQGRMLLQQAEVKLRKLSFINTAAVSCDYDRKAFRRRSMQQVSSCSQLSVNPSSQQQQQQYGEVQKQEDKDTWKKSRRKSMILESKFLKQKQKSIPLMLSYQGEKCLKGRAAITWKKL